MKKKIISLLLLIIIAITLVGCGNKKENSTSTNTTTNQTTTVTNPDSYNRGSLNIPETEVANMEKKVCTRQGSGEDSSEVKLNYTLYYQGEYLQILHSIEQVITEDQEILDQYQNAYINIYKNYETLEYYETSVIREKDSVTNDTVINYAKLDTDKLLEIEGEEDNIIKDGKVKLDDWLEFAEQFGTTCE